MNCQEYPSTWCMAVKSGTAEELVRPVATQLDQKCWLEGTDIIRDRMVEVLPILQWITADTPVAAVCCSKTTSSIKAGATD